MAILEGLGLKTVNHPGGRRSAFAWSAFWSFSVRATEVQSKQLLRPARTFFGERDGFRLALRVRDVPLGVKTIESFPVVPFPCANV
jgi:hypothetical protein